MRQQQQRNNNNNNENRQINGVCPNTTTTHTSLAHTREPDPEPTERTEREQTDGRTDEPTHLHIHVTLNEPTRTTLLLRRDRFQRLFFLVSVAFCLRIIINYVLCGIIRCTSYDTQQQVAGCVELYYCCCLFVRVLPVNVLMMRRLY